MLLEAGFVTSVNTRPLDVAQPPTITLHTRF